MKAFVFLFGVLLGVLFAGEVQSSHQRGGTFSYRPNEASPYSVMSKILSTRSIKVVLD